MERCRGFAYFSALIATLGGFIQSYVTCIIAGALFFIASEFGLTPFQEGLAAGIILLGALAGSLLSGPLADRLGRRPALALSTLLYLSTALFAIDLSSYPSLLLLRFLTGIAVGMTSLLVPLYLAEIAPPSQRGAFVTAFQVAVTFGTLIAYLVNLVYTSSGNWRMMLFLAAFPAALQGLGLIFFPESPKWLLGANQPAKAARILSLLQTGASPPLPEPAPPASAALFQPSYRHLLSIGILLCLAQQLVGINAIIYFTPKIFAQAGAATAKDAMIPTLIIGAVNLLATFCALVLIDRLGRRKLLLLSQLGLALSLSFLILSFGLSTSLLAPSL